MSFSGSWTQDRVDALERLWRDGLSASQIAAALGGVTRNAVIGKVHRLGLSGRDAPARPGTRRLSRPGRRVPRAKASASSPTPRRAASPPPEGPGWASVLSIGAHACRWPIGDPKDEGFTLCGRPATRGAYCAPHADLAYRPLDRRPPADHLLKLAGLA